LCGFHRCPVPVVLKSEFKSSLTPSLFIQLPVLSQEKIYLLFRSRNIKLVQTLPCVCTSKKSERSFVCLLRVSILHLSTMLLLKFEIVPTVCYCLFFILHLDTTKISTFIFFFWHFLYKMIFGIHLYCTCIQYKHVDVMHNS
jgi:hypothetical protein